MEFRKMVTITLYARQEKRHKCIEQSFGLCGRGRGWDDLGECHGNMYNIYKMNCQSRFDAGYRMLGAGALRWPRGMVRGGRWGGRFRMGNMCAPMVDSCWCMAKPIQYCKVKKKKSFKLGFSSTWTENFQMYKLGFKKAEEPEIKLPTFAGS